MWIVFISMDIVVECDILVNLSNVNDGALVLIAKISDKVMSF